MKLIGDLKKQVNNAKDISEKRSIIEKAGMKLSYEELNMVDGGCCSSFIPCSEDDKDYDKLLNCPVCGNKYKGTSCRICEAQGLEESSPPHGNHNTDPRTL